MKTWCGACVVAAWWCVAAAENCDVIIGDRRYMQETLVSNVGYPQGLAVDYSTRNMYFSFYNGSWYNAKLHFKDKDFSVIKELKGPCAFTIDQQRGKVHAGCSSIYRDPGGLYAWDSNTGRFELAGEEGRDVRFVHYHNHTLYYSARPELLLRTFSRGHSVRLSAPTSLVTSLVVDAQGDFLFTNATGVFRRRGHGEELRYAEFEWKVWVLAVDGSGAPYVCDSINPGGIWWLHDGPPATRLLDVQCTGMTFDSEENIIYGNLDLRSIVRLVQC